MPYFSFSTREILNLNKFEIFEKNTVYFSKNTELWKILNSNSNKKFINFCNIEKRKKVKKIKSKILFCLPPSIGFGDAVEYGTAINNIKKNNNFKYIGVAFAGRFSILYNKYFLFDSVYNEVIKEEELNKYETIFHFTLEIKALEKQKYERADISKEIKKYFNYQSLEILEENKLKKINKISIFPISKSPIRTMPIFLLNELISFLKNKINLDICFDINSDISNFVEKNISKNGYNHIKPSTFNSLLSYIENLEYGIFMDSGPLHFAKHLNKQGMLIETSVSEKILLNESKNIKSINNNYASDYCSAPCGLTNIFNYKNKVGCYQSINVEKNRILNLHNYNQLQRGATKNHYIHYLINPVGCLKSLDINSIIKELNSLVN